MLYSIFCPPSFSKKRLENMIIILHEFVDRRDNNDSVPRATVWHHEALPSDPWADLSILYNKFSLSLK